MRNRFWKGHALGNDYLVLDPRELDFPLTPRRVRALCDRHRGVGGDGVLELVASRRADFGLRIWNPDGSRAEKSGNGLRIFARFLFATGRTRRTRLCVETAGGVVAIRLLPGRDGIPRRARVEIGHASFAPVERRVRVAGRALRFTGVSVGNPHCVVFAPRGRRWSRADLLVLGPRLERHPYFPKRCNVQLAARTGPHALEILIWERGAGETAASGTSACAAACAAIRLGLVASPVVVRAPGGALRVTASAEFDVTLEGAVDEVASGALAPSFVRALR
ncbi:MAG TPA: diaminopimelate epimerase [Myxococcota bacterium]|jgi:diaminopimelate epimerase